MKIFLEEVIELLEIKVSNLLTHFKDQVLKADLI